MKATPIHAPANVPIEGPYRHYTRTGRAINAVVDHAQLLRSAVRREIAKAREFVVIYHLYRVANTRRYSAQIAFGCVYRGLPF